LCDALPQVANRYFPSLVSDATAIANKFQQGFEKFGSCHTLYNGNHLTDEDIDQLGK